jgi:thiol-disulfide isomerase/thioredoxin
LQKDFRKKQLEYVVKYPQSYYSFYIFRSDVAGANLIVPDSLLVVFNSFPDKFKYSDEGNYLHELILGKVPFKMNAAAIDFVATDINKKRVALSGFKGKKYVLLQFWATWCTPCMKEVNALKEINNRYQSKGLQIISVALKSSSYAEFTNTIKQKGMNWIHIYNDLELYNKYGDRPIPRICLIDINGKLVYDRIGLGDENDFQLKELNRLLEETIK